ncbi:MAG: NAD(P)/FAD-dependent oxidoreductase, partial [Pseudomonadota bacterium]
MENKIHDTIIIGAGPAGLAASLELSKNDYPHLLIDKNSFPKDKICGDAITNHTLKILKEYKLEKEVRQKAFAVNKLYRYANKEDACIFDTNAVIIKRKVFDSILFEKASQSVEFINAIFTGNIEYDNIKHKIEFISKNNNQPFYLFSRYVILATGCQDPAVFSSIKKHTKIKDPDQIAFRGYYKANWTISENRYYFDKELNPGYSWIFPLGNNVFNVGCGGKLLKTRNLNLKECLSNMILQTDLSFNTKGSWLEAPRAAFLRTNLSNLKHLRYFPNLILAGETLGSSYPFSGNGTGRAMISGILAAKSIVEFEKNKKD